jgi:hypothetical protein
MTKLRKIEVFPYRSVHIASESDRQRYDLIKDVGEVLNLEALNEELIKREIADKFPSFIDISEYDFPNLVTILEVPDSNNSKKTTFLLQIILPDEVVADRVKNGQMSYLDRKSISIEIVQFAKRESLNDLVGLNVESRPVYQYIMNRLTDRRNPKLTAKQKDYVLRKIEYTLTNYKTKVRRVSWESDVELATLKNGLKREGVPDDTQESSEHIDQSYFEDDVDGDSGLPSTDWLHLDVKTDDQLRVPEPRGSMVQSSGSIEEQNTAEFNTSAMESGGEVETNSKLPRRSVQRSPKRSNSKSKIPIKKERSRNNEGLTPQEQFNILMMTMAAVAVWVGHGYIGVQLSNYMMEVYQLDSNLVPLIWTWLVPTIAAFVGSASLTLIQGAGENFTNYQIIQKTIKKYIMAEAALLLAVGIVGYLPAVIRDALVQQFGVQDLPFDEQTNIILQEIKKWGIRFMVGAGALGAIYLALKLSRSEKKSNRNVNIKNLESSHDLGEVERSAKKPSRFGRIAFLGRK